MLQPGPDSLNPPSTKPPQNTFEVSTVHTQQPQSSTVVEHGNHKHKTERSASDKAFEDTLDSMSTQQNMYNFKFFNFDPKHMTCPHCHKHITTKLRFVSGETAWSWCICCLLMGCCLGCCFLPFYVDRFRDVVHVCPHCHRDIVKYHRNDPTNHRRI